MKCILTGELIKRLSHLGDGFLLMEGDIDKIIRDHGDDYYWDRNKLDMVKVERKCEIINIADKKGSGGVYLEPPTTPRPPAPPNYKKGKKTL